MSKRIEEVFNDCFERLLLGESLESCLLRYPEYSDELDSMLRTAFDVKRKAFPVQPRPEFKYWARVRMQNVQYYSEREPEEEKVSGSNLRRNLAFSLAALLVFVIASSGTAAASSQAMPDEPLYTVKMAVEQAQLTLTTSDVDKAELYAHLAEKRAQEIAVMADKGKTDQVVATTAKLNYQLEQADALLTKYEAALAASGALPGSVATTPKVVVPPLTNIPVVPPAPPQVTTPTPTSAAVSENTSTINLPPPPTPLPLATVENATAENATVVTTPVQPANVIAVENATVENATLMTAPVQPPAAVAAENITVENATVVTTSDNKSLAGSKRLATLTQNLKNVNEAKTSIDVSTDKSLTILQNALDKAPESVKSSLNDAIQKTKKARERITSLQTSSENQTSITSETNTTTNISTPIPTSTTSVTSTNVDNSSQYQGTTNRLPDKHKR
jgi:hypothetical protein